MLYSIVTVLLFLTKYSSSINLLEPSATRKTFITSTQSPCMLSKLLLSKYKYEDKKNISKALDNLNEKGIFNINVNFNCGEKNKSKCENSVALDTRSTVMRKGNDLNTFDGGYRLLSGSLDQNIDDDKPKTSDTETKILGVLKDISNKIDKSMKTLNIDKQNAKRKDESIAENGIQIEVDDEKELSSAEYEIEIIPKKKPKKRFTVVNKKRSGKGNFNQQHQRAWRDLLHKIKMPSKQINMERHDRIEPYHYWDEKKVNKDLNNANKIRNKHVQPNRPKSLNIINKVGNIKNQKNFLPVVDRIRLKNIFKKIFNAHISKKRLNSKSKRPTNNHIMKNIKILNDVSNSHSNKMNFEGLSWEFDDLINLSNQQDLSNEDSSNSESIDEHDIPLWLYEDTKSFKREKRSTIVLTKQISTKPVEGVENITERKIQEITSNKNKSSEDLKLDVGKLLRKVSDERLLNNITESLINKMFKRLRQNRPSHPDSKEQIEILLNPQLSDIEESSEVAEGPDDVKVLGGGKFKLKEGTNAQENNKRGRSKRKTVRLGEPVYL